MPEKMGERERPNFWTQRDKFEYALACLLSDLDYAKEQAPTLVEKEKVVVLIERCSALLDESGKQFAPKAVRTDDESIRPNR